MRELPGLYLLFFICLALVGAGVYLVVKAWRRPHRSLIDADLEGENDTALLNDRREAVDFTPEREGHLQELTEAIRAISTAPAIASASSEESTSSASIKG